MYVMNSSKREKMSWTKSRKRPGPKEYFFSFADKRLFPLLFFFPEAFLVDLTLPILSPQSLYDGVRLQLQNFPRIRWAIFLVGTRRCPKHVFHWLAAWPSWQPLWWGVISFQKFTSLKLGLYFCMVFLASSELILDIDLTDSYEIWPKYSLVINAKKRVRLFLIFQILLLLRALMWRRSANIQFANFKIAFLGKQSEYQKSLTPFYSLSPTDWHWAVCLVVLPTRKAGNSV